MDAQQLIQDGCQFAKLAVSSDEAGNYKVAIFYYLEAAEALKKALDFDRSLVSLNGQAIQYLDRAETLHQQIQQGKLKLQRTISQTDDQKGVEKAEFLLKQAIEEDENGRREQALPLYMDAVQLCIEAAKGVSNPALKEKLSRHGRAAIARAEELKGIQQTKPGHEASVNHLTHNVSKIGIGSTESSTNRPKLTPLELETLKHSSYINRRIYPPWMDVDRFERFAFPISFSDPDGPLTLAPKQKAKFAKWIRPSDLCENPHMIYAVSSLSIRQTVISDCSFVASLAISAAYERKFRKRLITSIIYPQNKVGDPIINPCGKYMLKLRINGVPRKVIIDDTLPVGKDGELLCSYSNNSDEFWVSLLEKAYLKIFKVLWRSG